MAMANADVLVGMPGERLIRKGLADSAAGRPTVESCLVAIARPRLERAGLLPSRIEPETNEPERELYRLLQSQGGDAYSRYTALLRELASFEAALDGRLRRVEAS
jgi:hypothetical protein